MKNDKTVEIVNDTDHKIDDATKPASKISLGEVHVTAGAHTALQMAGESKWKLLDDHTRQPHLPGPVGTRHKAKTGATLLVLTNAERTRTTITTEEEEEGVQRSPASPPASPPPAQPPQPEPPAPKRRKRSGKE